MPVTLKEIAAKVGVHPSTISRVLSGKYDNFAVSEETRELILKTVEQYQYVPNEMARGLRLKKTHTIGIVIPDILNPFFAGIARSIEIACENRKYSFIICSTDEVQEKETKLIELLKSKRMDGLLIVPVQDRIDQFKELKAENYPFVLIERCFDDLNTNAVVTENESEAYQAVEHLIKLGHRRIAFISGRRSTYEIKRREKGYRAALTAYGLPVQEQLIVGNGFAAEDGYHATLEILQLPEKPTAFLVSANVILVGVLEAIFELGLIVPDDISVVGFTDLKYAPYFASPLTTVSRPVDQIGKRALQLLLRQMDSPAEQKCEKIVLQSKFIIRKSTHKPIGS